ncbi:hypothetical protein D3C86_1421330 [compost metagenome]
MPMAAMTGTPLERAVWTAADRVLFSPGPPRLRLITSAPFLTAQVIPRATYASEPAPSAASTLMGMILASGAMPATPCPLLAAAAATPAQWVPWPWSSLTSLERVMALKPVTTRPANSGCVVSRPVSSTAMTMPLPLLVRQAWGACTIWGAYCWG